MRTAMRWASLLLTVLVLIVAAAAPQYVAQAAPPGQSPDEGKSIFEQKCVACHTVGGGDLLGPDLAGVTARREADWLTRWLSAPDQMLAAQDPIAVDLLQKYKNLAMPNLRLTDGDVAALMAYLETAAPTAGGAAPVVALPEGNPNIGKNLFTGVKRLENRGPSCRTCHTATGIGTKAGQLGGGALGPDLTGIYGRLGDSTIGMPLTGTMEPIFSEKPLTPEEQANLLAFFEAAGATKRSSQTILQLSGIAVGGLVVVAGLTQLVWRRRLRNVRKPMVAG